MKRTCNYHMQCKHKQFVSMCAPSECSFANFCDFQAPRDSRLAMHPDGHIIKIEEDCIICGQPLHRCEGHLEHGNAA